MRTISLREVQYFVKNTLKGKLRKDLRDWRIRREAEVENCSYYHLRKFLNPDRDWRVFARRHSSRTGFYTDLLIFQGTKPRIAIETKWRKNGIPEKDRRALASALTNLEGVEKAYFYVVMPDASGYVKLKKKTDIEKNRLFERVVDLHYSEEDRKEWQRKRAEFKLGKIVERAEALDNEG
jgi:hypothetical protein